MNYFIQYPCYVICNLRCSYCFRTTDFDRKDQGGPNFTIDDYLLWRNTHLKDRENLVIHFHGGETTLPKNIDLITEFYSKTQEEKLDVLTNGLGPVESYDRLIDLKPYIFRIGFTYHRKVIDHDKAMKKIFVDRVLKLKKAGVPIYVKEMLFIEDKPNIIAHQRFWKMMGVPFKIQDFKGYTRGEDFSELKKYTIDDINLIDGEYIKKGGKCYCLPGYKQIMIRGGWQAGDILGCWVDPVVVGNIKENTFNPNYITELDPFLKKTVVKGVPKIYRGTYEGDRYYDSLKKNGLIDYTSTDTLKGEEK